MAVSNEGVSNFALTTLAIALGVSAGIGVSGAGTVSLAQSNSLTLSLDLTSSLPSIIDFARADPRNYITAGVLTALSTGLPAFESWDGVNRGLAIEPAFTNLQTYSNDFTNAIWTKTGGAVVAGDTGPGALLQFTKFESTATNAYHRVITKPGSQAIGLTQTWSAYIKPEPGSDIYSVWIQMAPNFDNAGAICHFRIDGNEGFFPVLNGGHATNVRYGYRKMAGDVIFVWITGTWAATGDKQFQIGTSAKTNTDARTYTATTSSKFQMAGASLTTTSGPVSYVATTSAGVARAGESAIFNDTSWLTTAQGTFVIDHDCWVGTLLGSGANALFSATAPGRTVFTWDATGSKICTNGGAVTTGPVPTFSGSDVRLLATTGVTNCGHISLLQFLNVATLTDADIQLMSARPVVSTANPGTLRTVAVENRTLSFPHTTTGTVLTQQTRFKYTLGTGDIYDVAGLRINLAQLRFAAKTPVGNDLTVDKMALERVTGVVEYVPVTYLGQQSFVIPDGAVEMFADPIPPSAFTGLTKFDGGMEFWERVKVSVPAAGNVIMGSRDGAESGCFARNFDPAATTYSDVYGTGDMTLLSGPAGTTVTRAYSPCLFGTFVSGDPKTFVLDGDSTIEGTGSLGATGVYTKLAAKALGIPMLEISAGGMDQLDLEENLAGWSFYLGMGRVLIDAMGRNDSNANLAYFSYYKAFKEAGGDKIMKIVVFPATSGTFATEAGQTVLRAYPSNVPDTQAAEWLKYGAIDYIFDAQSIRGTNLAKWFPNATTDGTHESDSGNALLDTEVRTPMTAITVT